MERKAKTGVSVWLLVGIIFTVVGAVFAGIAVALLLVMRGIRFPGLIFLVSVFGGLGLLLLAVGLVFLIRELQKRISGNRLLRQGSYVLAEITEITYNYSVSVNGRHPYIIKCMYQDGAGNLHIFKSRDLNYDPGTMLKDQKVKVYVDGEDFRHYYVDIDEILPRVIEH